MVPPTEPQTTDPRQETKWDEIANSRAFQDLLSIKKLFIVPAFIFFLTYYFALPLLVGYAPKLMSRRVVGHLTLAYVFALSQFLVGWTIAGLYIKAAADFDQLSRDITDPMHDTSGGR